MVEQNTLIGETKHQKTRDGELELKWMRVEYGKLEPIKHRIRIDN